MAALAYHANLLLSSPVLGLSRRSASKRASSILTFTKVKFEEDLFKFILTTQSSFILTENVEFRALINGLNPRATIPGGDTVRRGITTLYRKLRKTRDRELDAAPGKLSFAGIVQHSQTNYFSRCMDRTKRCALFGHIGILD